jgi:hypothetical protein
MHHRAPQYLYPAHTRWGRARSDADSGGVVEPGAAALRGKSPFRRKAIERKRFLRTRIYQDFVRPVLFWIYGYVIRLGFLDGIQGLIFHTLQRFWFRFLIDAKIWEIEQAALGAANTRGDARR